jgi:hypothetical protein
VGERATLYGMAASGLVLAVWMLAARDIRHIGVVPDAATAII